MRRAGILFALVLLFSGYGLASCNLAVSRAEGTLIWLDVPIDGLTIPIHQELLIEGHASSSSGIVQVEVWVNSDRIFSQENPPARDNLVYYETTWLPPDVGDYVIQVIATDGDGVTSQPDRAVVHVQPEPTPTVATSTFTPTSTATNTFTPTFTATPTFTPTFTATYTPTMTFTPTETPTFTPSATASDTPTPTRTFTPTEVPDTDPPDAPHTGYPKEGSVIACTKVVTLEWSAVTDPSGLREYRVWAEYSTNGTDYTPTEDSPHRGLDPDVTTFNQSVTCKMYYRWKVRAVDNAGNASDWSDWSRFIVR